MPAIKLKKVTAEYLAEKESKEKMKEKTKKNLEDVAEEENKTPEVETKTDSGGKMHNFLEVEILFDKRKRVPPPAEQKLTDWLDSNLMAKEDVNLPLTTLYEYYSEVCQMQGEPVVDVPVFNRYIRDKFGKSFGFQENSPYRVLIKERKVKEKKPKVEGETMQIKIRDIITNVINDLGNPTKGLRFQIISKTIVQKYPAKRVDLYPNKLKSGLERGVMYGYIERVRGVGMCGYYRVPGKPTKEEVDEKKNKKKHSTEALTGEEGEDEAKEGSVENGDTGDNNVDNNKNDNEGKSTDDEKKDDNNDDKKTDDDKPDYKTDPETEEKPDKTSKVKKTQKKKKKKPVEQWAKSNLAKHSDPDKVEDVFPLAITYQTDPKQATGSKIKSYISKFYRVEVSNDRLRKALDNGVEKGLWELTSGSAPNGRYHLLVESFYPGRSDSLKDQIAQALVACNEPKQASASLIKKYITKYHPKLNVESRPHLFKHALERACMKGNITQLSGIGASGTFELKDHFYPSPAILAGDSSDSEEEEDDVDSDNQVPEYVPRPTKRTKSAPKPKPSSRSVTLPAKKMKPSISPKPVEKKKGVAKSKNSKGARNARKAAIIEASDSSDDEPAEYTPRPTKRRGGSSSTPVKKKATPSTTSTASKRGRAADASTPKKGTNKVKPSKSKTVVESDDGVEEEEETGMEYTPRPTKSRNAAAKPTPEPSKSTSRSRGGKRALVEPDADDESEEEIVSPPKKRKNIKIDVNTEAKKTSPAKNASKRRR
ncbi:Heterochromatin protein 1-binding protein 3 [Mactra antiquata]